MEPTDDQLIATCLGASHVATEAFTQLYRRHAGVLLSFLRGLHPGDEHAAQDALQESFFRFHTSLSNFEQGRPLRPWLFKIARNLSLDTLRKAQVRPDTSGPQDALGLSEHTAQGPAEAASRQEAGTLMRQAVDRLPNDQRVVFLLRHDHGLTYAQVADAVGCSVRTTKYRMKSALEELGREAERIGVV